MLVTTAAALAPIALPAGAQEVQETEFAVFGSWSSLPLHKQFE